MGEDEVIFGMDETAEGDDDEKEKDEAIEDNVMESSASEERKIVDINDLDEFGSEAGVFDLISDIVDISGESSGTEDVGDGENDGIDANFWEVNEVDTIELYPLISKAVETASLVPPE